MPNPQEILAGLRIASSEALVLAVVWHGLTLAAVIALLFGWKPSRRAAGALLAVPIASVGIVAFAYGNPFNGTLFGLLALALVGIASRLDARRVQRGEDAARIVGILMLAFAWVYPHFLESQPAAIYLGAAPVGVIPCPTLSLVIGFALLSGGLGSRAWSVPLAAAGLFYGLFGVIRLGVRLDAVLIVGATVLSGLALGLRARTPSPFRAKKAGAA